MKFIRELLNRKPKEEQGVTPEAKPLNAAAGRQAAKTSRPVDPSPAAKLPKTATLRVVSDEDGRKSAPKKGGTADTTGGEAAVQDDAAVKILDKVNAKVATETPKESSGVEPVNIWDMDGDDEEAAAAPQEAPASGQRRRRRNQTRVLGFDDAADDTVSAFDAAKPVAPSARATFPVGWVLVVEGEGRGECFSLEAGMSQIGRAEDQAVQLDFGDNSISRVNHAAIVYDTETHVFILGHGGKKNIVRLNGKPVISNETITTGDEIKIGETTLRFVALCTEEFNWADQENASEEQDDVAIA